MRQKSAAFAAKRNRLRCPMKPTAMANEAGFDGK